jgi:ribonucleotide reductase alpha subunit
MERVEKNKLWSLMCPSKCPNLYSTHGAEFTKIYLEYENNKLYNRQVPARDLWKHILESQIETGLPYILYKDSANEKSNQKNLGTIRSSNLYSNERRNK